MAALGLNIGVEYNYTIKGLHKMANGFFKTDHSESRSAKLNIGYLIY
jgi:hypothetical protein